MNKNVKIVLTVLLTLLLLTVIAIFGLRLYFSPTPDYKRNNEVDGVKVEIKVSNDERKPILKTIKLSEYEKMSEDEKSRIEDFTSGRVEGDITCVHLLDDKNAYFKFYKNNEIVNPDTIPIIEIVSHPSHYRDKSGKKDFKYELEKLSNNEYSFEFDRYNTQYEKYFMEYDFIKLKYKIEGTDYITLFSTFKSNAPDGTDFFKNEDLKEPLEPTVNK